MANTSQRLALANLAQFGLSFGAGLNPTNQVASQLGIINTGLVQSLATKLAQEKQEAKLRTQRRKKAVTDLTITIPATILGGIFGGPMGASAGKAAGTGISNLFVDTGREPTQGLSKGFGGLGGGQGENAGGLGNKLQFKGPGGFGNLGGLGKFF